ncbi:Deoxyribodipyrimidine photo-lyase [Vibrio stylophorae]|uniref:Deoxyribodipyrimidine photo-lyase n=1 Tax=Vibrio stylophorae TaxID=659351 RepID=A0ABM8ZX92_9VIBR|nr:deoxyribodipyrimidine photo-lyase [Vibrio stylophorae]CAH0535199.1 Deoxyribodipyrimidine photo-lyase [Vibrio stylophorae]
MSNIIHLVWLRGDLRLVDNQALNQAQAEAEKCGGVIHLIYLATPAQWHRHDMAAIQADLIYRRLEHLALQAAALGMPFHYFEVSDYRAQVAQLLRWAKQQSVHAVYANVQHWPYEKQRDAAVRQQLPNHIQQHWCDDVTLIAPGQVRNQQGEMFRVFTPFYHQWRNRLRELNCQPTPLPAAQGGALSVTSISPFIMPRKDSSNWPVSDEAIHQVLTQFCQARLSQYGQDRDFPALEGTSTISPYLAIGAISPRQCLAAALMQTPDLFYFAPSGAERWLSELAWREFYYHLMAAWPKLAKGRPFKAQGDVYWQVYDAQRLQAWQQGMTGYVFVDAAMRALNATGWMHNRLRMICASFLVKDLHIDWRYGERYFMQQLIDGDLASNNGGWQWAASCGCDAQPYFRIFNPISQARKFDPAGQFIRQWLPELAKVPDKFLFEPHAWAQKHGVMLNYPTPIVEHRKQRELALARFEAAKQGVVTGSGAASEVLR